MNRKIADGAPAHAQQDALEIQVETRLRYSQIDEECVLWHASHSKTADSDRTQKRRLDLVDVNNEAFVPGFPPDPQPNPIGNGEWGKPNRKQRGEQDQQTSEKQSILERHRLAKA